MCGLPLPAFYELAPLNSQSFLSRHLSFLTLIRSCTAPSMPWAVPWPEFLRGEGVIAAEGEPRRVAWSSESKGLPRKLRPLHYRRPVTGVRLRDKQPVTGASKAVTAEEASRRMDPEGANDLAPASATSPLNADLSVRPGAG